jgi:protein-disulfide isomerase
MKSTRGFSPFLFLLASSLLSLWACKGVEVPTALQPISEAKAEPVKESPAAPAAGGLSTSGSAGPCQALQARVCAEAGPEAEGCLLMGAAIQILPDKACQAALDDFKVTLGKVRAMRAVCDEMAAKLCADIGPDTVTCYQIKEQAAQFPAQQCQMMMSQYDEVLKELQAIEAQNKPLTPELKAKQAAGDAPSFGPADAKVVLVAYSDFECPYCSQAAATLSEVKERYGEVVRVVFRQFPLPFHEHAMLAAQASMAAHAQGKFWALHDAMFASGGKLDRAGIDALAKAAGLNMAAFKAALDKEVHKAAVEADVALAREVGVQGTPTLYVGGERVMDATNFAMVAAGIEAQLKAAGVAVP